MKKILIFVSSNKQKLNNLNLKVMKVIETGINETRQSLVITEDGPAIIIEEVSVSVITSVVPLIEFLGGIE